MELFTYLMAKNDHNTSVKKDLFSYLLGKNQSGTYTDYSGTSLSINNTKKGKMKVNLLGNTSQASYTGKNLFNAQNQAGVYGNAIYTVSSNGEISQSATDTSAFGNDQARNFQLSAGTYTISILNRPSNVYLQLRNISNNTNILENKTDSYTFTLNETTTLACKTWSTDTSLYPISYYIQIETGSPATSYEPYTGGIPSPNPSYPQDVHIVSGDNTIVSTGKNLVYLQLEGKNINNTGQIVNTTGFNLNIARVISGETYTASKTTESSNWDFVCAFYESEPSLGSQSYNSSRIVQSKNPTFTAPITGYVAFRSDSDISNIQLEVGSTPTTYEPYTSTSYPIHLGDKELCKISTYQDRFIRTTGKNLFNPTFQVEHQYLADSTEATGSNIGYTLSNGVITSNKNVNQVGRRMLNKLSLSAGTYTISGKVKFNNASSYNIFNSVRDMGTLTDIKPLFEINVGSATGTFNFSFTLSQDVENVSISLQPMTANDGTLELSELQLEKSSSATSYEPYGTGEWYLEKKIGKVVFDGSEDINMRTTGMFGITTNPASVLTANANELIPAYCNRATANTRDNVYNGTNGVAYGSANNYYKNICLRLGSITSIDDFKTYVQNNETIVYYILATPTYTPITGTLKDELEAVHNAKSYKGTTNINQINNDLPFNMDVSVKVGS